MSKSSPTQQTYRTLDDAYRFFNERLFGGKLPNCLITMQRKKGARGYFSHERFGLPDDADITDEIALNPALFHERTSEETLSTLAHEMTHLEQHHFGAPSRGGYHNKEWARLMEAIGLIPTDTGEPGGRKVGQRVSHTVEPGGAFDLACAELLSNGFDPLYGDRERNPETKKKKAASKTKYTCPTCELNAWAKPQATLICGDCKLMMEEAIPNR